jgi:hypothetical protein
MSEIIEKAIVGFLAAMSLITVFAYFMAVREHRIWKKKNQSK